MIFRSRVCCAWLIGLVTSLNVGTAFAGPADAHHPPSTEKKTSLVSLESEYWNQLSLSELFELEVESVSRSTQKLKDAPAAIYVITHDDIRDYGHQNLAEVLRMAPGMHVARNNAQTWSVAARGLNGRFSRMQLVQRDGRLIYNNLFSGVFWMNHDHVLEDIDQIEVIRGPGASLWGANAVNGIISINSKPTWNTLGLHAEAVTGTHVDHGFTTRYGFQLSEQTFARIYAKRYSHGRFDKVGQTGYDYDDGFERNMVGMRIDHLIDPDRELMVEAQWAAVDAQTDYFLNDPANPLTIGDGRRELSDANKGNNSYLLTKYTHRIDEHTINAKAYTECISQLFVGGFRQRVSIIDLEAQHTWQIKPDHKLIWGLGMRHLDSRADNGAKLILVPNELAETNFNGFLQHTWHMYDELIAWTNGIKVEQNELTGAEYQPTSRIMITPHSQHRVWTSISRAVRTPSRAELHAIIPQAEAIVVAPATTATANLVGQDGFRSERLLALEAGYRYVPNHKLNIDISAYRHQFRYITSIESTGLNTELRNNSDQTYHGIETSIDVHPMQRLTLRSSVSYQIGNDSSLISPDPESLPRWLGNFRSTFAWSHNLSAITAFYYAGSHTDNDDSVEANLRMDLGIEYAIHPSASLSVFGQNLLQNRHREAAADTYISNDSSFVERGVVARLTVNF